MVAREEDGVARGNSMVAPEKVDIARENSKGLLAGYGCYAARGGELGGRRTKFCC